MTEFAASLAPGYDFAAIEMMDGFFDELLFAGRVFVNDFAVVQYGLDFLRRGFRAQCERSQRRSAGAAGGFPTRKKCRAQRCSGVAGNRLNVDVAKTAAL